MRGIHSSFGKKGRSLRLVQVLGGDAHAAERGRLDLPLVTNLFKWIALICWIGTQAAGHAAEPADATTNARPHWAFQPLASPRVPHKVRGWQADSPVDRFIHARLLEKGLAPSREAEKPVLIRRVAFLLTGLPPTPEEIGRFLQDRRSDAYTRMVRQYLDSPRYGERWGKHWLDTAGYADSNGYFSADSDRPLAYRYRDYVVRSFQRDKPFDQFVREQLAGDEISGWRPGQPANAGIVDLLEATHFLRNGQDGSGESDGNPDEVRTDRYYALESAMQIVGSSLLGLTVQCAKCHDHKFEPITQSDYYAFQAFLYPAFNVEQWVKPNDRIAEALRPGELEPWKETERRLDDTLASLRKELREWVSTHRPAGQILFEDSFQEGIALAERWSNTAPGDDAPGGKPAVQVDGDQAPAARVREGRLQIVEGGGSGDRWISTRTSFDWRPARSNEWIQASFELKAVRLEDQGAAAERIGWMIAMHDFDDSSATSGGNILIDGHPGGATAVQVDYPGSDAKGKGVIGATGYVPGHRYGARITRKGEDQYLLEHLVDEAPDGATLTLKGADLPAGGFGFEYCCGRSFVVDDVRIESSRSGDAEWTAKHEAFNALLTDRKKAFDERVKSIQAQRVPKPGRVAWVSDLSDKPPEVKLLKRGNHKTPGEVIEPAFPAFLASSSTNKAAIALPTTAASSGRRLSWARWVTEPGSPQSALLARVTVNRLWQHYFGTGIVSTPDNFGWSGARPSHPELLEWLASEFVRSGWSLKAVHRIVLESSTLRQASASREPALRVDPSNQLLWRYPLLRLDAESIRDAMLSASGRLGSKADGPYVPTSRNGAGEVVIDENRVDAFSRSIFLQQRRTQVATVLGVFDAPSIVFNCSRREPTTMPLQMLSLLNSDFAVKRGADLAERVCRESGDRPRMDRAFLLAVGRMPDRSERRLSKEFLAEQRKAYEGLVDGERRAWSDFCQSLFALNNFLYLE